MSASRPLASDTADRAVRIAYFGTPDDAVAPLRALVAAGHEIALVVTQPDRRRGRGGAATPSPVRVAAEELGLAVRTPNRARELVDELAALDLDAGVVVAFGQLLPASVLEAGRFGFVNLHFSVLPRWRGAAPVERAILAGDPETGVSVMALDQGMDTGPVYSVATTPIGVHETSGELRARLVDIGTPLLVGVVDALGSVGARPQEGAPTHAAKLSVEEFRLDWSRPAVDLARVVRAGNPRPGAWTELDGQRVKILRASAVRDAASADAIPGTVDRAAQVATREGSLVLEEVQPAGKPAMPARAWLAGRQGTATRFDSISGDE